MATKKRFFALLAGMSIVAVLGVTSPGRASDVDRLLDLLVKKRVLSQEEATAFREEAKKDQEAKFDPAGVAKPLEKDVKEAASNHAQAIVEKQSPTAEKKDHPVTGASKIKLSGWAQTRMTNGASATNSLSTLELRRARLAVDGNLTSKTAYRVQIDAVRSPVLLDARVDHTFSRYAKVTVGQFKTPFSQENLTTARDMAPIERSLVGLSLVPGRDTGNNGRDIGAQLGGSVTRSDGRPLFDYAVGVFNGSGINRRDDNRRKDAATRLVVHPLSGLSMGGSYYNGESGLTYISRERAGVEFAYARDHYSLRGEYIWGHDGAVRKYGWYSQFAYRFRPQWEALARFDNYEPNLNAGQDVTNTYLVGVNWYLNKHVKLQTNYGLVDEESRSDLTNLFLSQVQFQF